MHYSIDGLCPRTDLAIGAHGFLIKLFPGFKEMVAIHELNQKKAEAVLAYFGRAWLDACGYTGLRDSGPKMLYRPNHEIRVDWGEWGLEHITVPGNACGLDISDGISAPGGGRILGSHNVDCWAQKQLLLIVFCWFAETLSLHWEIEHGWKPPKQEARDEEE